MKNGRPRPLVAGNWKMHGLRGSASVLEELRQGYTPEIRARVDLLVCPPATLVHTFALAALGSRIAIGGQDAHQEQKGAYTGNISAEMLSDLGATHVILGHSERRAYHREDDSLVRAKADAARMAGLTSVICVGETREERESGKALDVVTAQVRGSLPKEAGAFDTIIAYEPVWAIGTGLTPSPDDVAEMHKAIRTELERQIGANEASQMRILYGGSVKPANARELLGLANVDGALVGGASLVAKDFLAIAEAYLP